MTSRMTARFRGRPAGRRRSAGLALLALSALSLAGASGCALQPDPLTRPELEQSVQADLASLYRTEEPLQGPLTVYDAMARVLKYNLDNRMKLMADALAMRQVDVASLSMLPQIAASAGYVSRSNVNASSSQSITTGQQSLVTSTSEDRDRRVADLSVTWNLLDFGVSYIGARQQTDRALISQERRRKVIQNTLQDARLVFWRAVAAQRLQDRIGPLVTRIDTALRDSESIGAQRLSPPLEALAYQKSLLRTRQQLLDLQRDLQVAKTQLATLMNLPPATELVLTAPAEADRRPPVVNLTPEQIESIALLDRPELVEEAYQARIGADETRKAMLRMLPGIELTAGGNYDSNGFLLYNNWANYGARIVWNLFNVVTGPANVKLAEAQEEFIDARRLALAMAVLTQSRVAWLRYRQSVEDWQVARRLDGIQQQISRQVRDQVAAQQRGELDAIQAEFEALVDDLGEDLAYAETQNAAGNILVTMGVDPLPDSLPDADLKTVAAALEARETAWFSGTLPADAKPMAMAPATDPATDPGLARTVAAARPARPAAVPASVRDDASPDNVARDGVGRDDVDRAWGLMRQLWNDVVAPAGDSAPAPADAPRGA